MDLTEQCVPDSRAFFNAIELLRMRGLRATANQLAEIGRDTIIRKRLYEIAESGGYAGGLALAEESTEE